MRATGCPVVFVVTHSLQRPGGLGTASGGEPALAAMMARAAAAVPVDGFFIETHPEPKKALSDAASMLPLDQLETLLRDVSRIATLAHELSNGRVSP
jgi:2-dehydro-3-deoxyphosphooctonate aldolase (KDO 8-P synthase)